METKIELSAMPEVKKVSDFIGEDLLDRVAEIISLYEELKSMVVNYNGLVNQREEASIASDEYLRIGLHQTTTNDTRRFVVRGIESDMLEILRSRDRIKSTLKSILYPLK